MKDNNAVQYWKTNLKYLVVLISITCLVSFGFAIWMKDIMDLIPLGGFKLGFWFAQQGSIYVFILVIFAYLKLMNKLDKKHGFDE